MKATQYTTYQVNGKAVTEEYLPIIENESDHPGMVESQVIGLYPKFTDQVIDGFGGAMTESSAYLLSRLPEEERRKAIEDLFGENGLRFNFVRIPIDSCDYSLDEYQAVADPIADPELETFTLERDRKYIIPMMKEVLEVASKPISVLLSPWSPPYQWKTAPAAAQNDGAVYGGMMHFDRPENKPQRSNGGSLRHEFYGSWAKYLVKFIQAYQAEGIPVTMLSMQNETVAATNWDSCVWTPEEAKDFLENHLYPAFRDAGLDKTVDIFVWDHNKERMVEHVTEVLAGDTKDKAEGVAFHWYSGDHFEAVSLIHKLYPDKKLFLTECCGLHEPGSAGYAGVNNGDPFETPAHADYKDAAAYAHDIIGNMNAGMNGWIDWNLMVNENGGPRHVPGGFTSGLIAHEKEGIYTKPLMHTYIKHFSHFMEAGAKRIELSRFDDTLDATAVKNPDGSIVLVILNKTGKDSGAFVRMEGTLTRVSCPAYTISTIIFD